MQTIKDIDWRDRWLGGFCALGAIGGLPIRGPDYITSPPLDRILTLPSNVPLEAASVEIVNAIWSQLLGGAPFVMVRSVERAYRLILEATSVPAGEVVGVPANATRPLIEALKQYGAQPFFLPLDDHLQLDSFLPSGARMVWSQSIAGVNDPEATESPEKFLDFSDSLPGDVSGAVKLGGSAVCVWGLHLDSDPNRSGAIISAHGESDLTGQRAMAALDAIQALLNDDDRVNLDRAQAQAQRLVGSSRGTGVAYRQKQSLKAVSRGLAEAAGLELRPIPRFGALAHGVAVRAPSECDPSTFYAYVKGENTPVRWLPELRPIHYAAVRQRPTIDDRLTAARLARWLIVPVGPDYTDQEISHSVLGIVKASEYLGVRWRTDPERALEYAALMNEMYGPDHDAFRLAFAPFDQSP